MCASLNTTPAPPAHTHWHMMYMRSEEACFPAVARFSLCIASCTHLGCYVRCSWRQSATSAHSRCISDTGNAGSDCRLIFDSVFAQWKHAGSKWVFTEIHFRLFAWKTSLSLCFLQSDDAWMFMCLWVCVCLSLPHNIHCVPGTYNQSCVVYCYDTSYKSVWYSQRR